MLIFLRVKCQYNEWIYDTYMYRNKIINVNTYVGLQDVLYHCSFESDSLDVCKMKQQTGNVYKWTRNKVIHPSYSAIIILNSISNVCLAADCIFSYFIYQSSLTDINAVLTQSRQKGGDLTKSYDKSPYNNRKSIGINGCIKCLLFINTFMIVLTLKSALTSSLPIFPVLGKLKDKQSCSVLILCSIHVLHYYLFVKIVFMLNACLFSSTKLIICALIYRYAVHVRKICTYM